MRYLRTAWLGTVDAVRKCVLPTHRWPDCWWLFRMGRNASRACWRGRHGNDCPEATCTCTCHQKKGSVL